MMVMHTEMKKLFFDQRAVIRAMDAKERRALIRVGSFIRRRARSSLRRRKKASAAGSPPSVHSRDKFATLKNILFAYDPGAKSVIVGPVGLTRKRISGSVRTVPALMEFGGTATQNHRRRKYPARSFMGPALEAEERAGTILDAFAGV